MKNTTKRAIVEGVKGVVGVVGGFSAGYVVDNIVKTLLPPQAKPWGKVAVVIGQSFLSSALADAGVNSACETIDEIADMFIDDNEELRKELEERAEECKEAIDNADEE